MLRQADIRDHWAKLRPLIERALEGDDDHPEEVYAACRGNTAALYVAEDAAFVLRWTGRGDLRVWIAVGFGDHGVLDRHDEGLADIARNAGAESMSFLTRRKGFERALPATWTSEATLYSRSV